MFFVFYQTQVWKLLSFNGPCPRLLLPLLFRFRNFISCFLSDEVADPNDVKGLFHALTEGGCGGLIGPSFLEMSFSTAGAATLLSHNSAVREPWDCEVGMDFPAATKSVPLDV